MPAQSKSQKALFSMVRAYKHGDLPHPSGKIKEVAEHVSDESASHFSKTPAKGLPEHVKEAFVRGFLKRANELHVDPERLQTIQKIITNLHAS